MIKGISFLRPAENAAAYERLASFFAALGFAPGGLGAEATPDNAARSPSRGASFLAPLGNLEFVDGTMPAVCRRRHRSHRARCRAPGGRGVVPRGRPGVAIRSRPTSRRSPKPIGSRAFFTVEPEPGHTLSPSGHGPIRSRASPWPSKAISPPRACALPSSSRAGMP